MCANINGIRSVIIDSLTNLDRLLCDWERQCAPQNNNKRHFVEIRSAIDRIKHHVRQVKAKATRSSGNMQVIAGIDEKIDRKNEVKVENKTKKAPPIPKLELTTTEEIIIDIPADAIEKKVMQEKTEISFRNREIRKASSWKYLNRWKEILDEEWTQFKNTSNCSLNGEQENCRGVNIIVPNISRQYAGRKQKFNSTECILDEGGETKLESSHKRCLSAGDLLENFDIIANNMECTNPFFGSNYLLSLRDLQSFDRLDNLDDLSLSSSESDDKVDIHKPKIVGVIYKDKL